MKRSPPLLPAHELLAKSRQRQEELRQLPRQLLSAQEAERRKISRELHLIARRLTDVHGRLAPLPKEAAPGAKSWLRKLAGAQRLVQQSVETVHRLARELRPSVLDDLGLIPALEAFLTGSMKDTGVLVTLKAPAGLDIPDRNRRTVLYRVAEEALRNVVRHARASRAVVNIRTLNGQGFAVHDNHGAPLQHRAGLLSMRERVEMIGGTLAIKSEPGHTTVRVELPPEQDAAKKPVAKKADTSIQCL
jgi:signal transduction histidine kinase